jgi:hypothetical protein
MIQAVEWSAHATRRLTQRGLSRVDVEATVRNEHPHREINRGAADWRVHGERADGRPFVVV